MLALFLIAACTTCDCLGGGARFDADAALPEVEAVFGGSFTGALADGESACERAGSAFVLEVEVSPPVCLDADTEDTGCDRVEAASYGMTAALTVDDEDTAFSGAIEVWSSPDGLAVSSSELRPDVADVPVEMLGLIPSTPLLGDAALDRASWDRRISADGEPAVWASCALVLAP
jgi:hypothetical protein